MKVIQGVRTFLTALSDVYDEAVNTINQYLKDRNNGVLADRVLAEIRLDSFEGVKDLCVKYD